MKESTILTLAADFPEYLKTLPMFDSSQAGLYEFQKHIQSKSFADDVVSRLSALETRIEMLERQASEPITRMRDP